MLRFKATGTVLQENDDLKLWQNNTNLSCLHEIALQKRIQRECNGFSINFSLSQVIKALMKACLWSTQVMFMISAVPCVQWQTSRKCELIDRRVTQPK